MERIEAVSQLADEYNKDNEFVDPQHRIDVGIDCLRRLVVEQTRYLASLQMTSNRLQSTTNDILLHLAVGLDRNNQLLQSLLDRIELTGK